jgi:isoleucyl-tRNA synthetase
MQVAIQKLETLFLELGNIREVEYSDDLPTVDSERWAIASEEEIKVLLDKIRNDTLEGEGLMRDLARRVQVLRKELGFSPTDIVDSVHIADLPQKDVELLNPFLIEMQELVRAKKVYVHNERIDINADWHENKLDKKKVYVAVL